MNTNYWGSFPTPPIVAFARRYSNAPPGTLSYVGSNLRACPEARWAGFVGAREGGNIWPLRHVYHAPCIFQHVDSSERYASAQGRSLEARDVSKFHLKSVAPRAATETGFRSERGTHRGRNDSSDSQRVTWTFMVRCGTASNRSDSAQMFKAPAALFFVRDFRVKCR